MAEPSIAVTIVGAAIKAASYVATGAIGWFGNVWKNRSKKNKMRRHLYKEIVFNYGILHREFESTPYSALAKGEPLHFAFDYYNHVKQDLDTFHDLAESNLIVVFYNHLESAINSKPLDVPGAVGYCMWAYGLVHDAADDERLDAMLLLKQSTPYIQMVLKKAIASVHQQRAEMSEALVAGLRKSKHLPPSSSE